MLLFSLFFQLGFDTLFVKRLWLNLSPCFISSWVYLRIEARASLFSVFLFKLEIVFIESSMMVKSPGRSNSLRLYLGLVNHFKRIDHYVYLFLSFPLTHDNPFTVSFHHACIDHIVEVVSLFELSRDETAVNTARPIVTAWVMRVIKHWF